MSLNIPTKKEFALCQVWCYSPVIPVLGMLRQDNLKIEGSLDYIVKSYLKKERNLSLLEIVCNVTGSNVLQTVVGGSCSLKYILV
jgi:hypothetical protein